MEVELFEIRNHLGRFRPFRELPPDVLDNLVGHIDVSYFRAGSDILRLGQPNDFLYFIRSGAVEVTPQQRQTLQPLRRGQLFRPIRTVAQPKRAISGQGH